MPKTTIETQNKYGCAYQSSSNKKQKQNKNKKTASKLLTFKKINEERLFLAYRLIQYILVYKDFPNHESK